MLILQRVSRDSQSAKSTGVSRGHHLQARGSRATTGVLPRGFVPLFGEDDY